MIKCKNCGSETTNKVYCSVSCAEKTGTHKHPKYKIGDQFERVRDTVRGIQIKWLCEQTDQGLKWIRRLTPPIPRAQPVKTIKPSKYAPPKTEKYKPLRMPALTGMRLGDDEEAVRLDSKTIVFRKKSLKIVF